jgi:hypothetical protein
METAGALTPASGTLLKRVRPFGWTRRRVISAVELPTTSVASAYRVDASIVLDPSVIDDEAWLEWGRANLTADEYARRCRAVEIDRAAAKQAAV